MPFNKERKERRIKVDTEAGSKAYVLFWKVKLKVDYKVVSSASHKSISSVLLQK